MARLKGFELLHHIRDASPESYDAIEAFVVENLGDEEFVRLTGTKYEKVGDLGAEGLTEEVIADAVGYMVEHGELLDRLVQQNRTAGQKLLDAVRNFLKKIRSELAKGGTEYERVDAAYTGLIEQMDGMEATLKDAIARAGEGVKNAAQTDGGVKYSIKHTKNNEPFVVVEEDILSGVPDADWAKTVKNNLRTKFPTGIAVGNSEIMVDRTSRREMTFSDYTQHLARNYPALYADKLRATNNTDEIIASSRNYINEALAHPRKDNIVSFARGDVLLRVGGNDYMAQVVVGTRANGKMLIYDILNLAPTAIEEKSRAQESVNPSKNETGRSPAPDNNSIRDNSEKSNTKFSMKKATDSEGRELTKEQQEFFKDSEVRDKDGNLLVVYHGSTAGDFTVFDWQQGREKGFARSLEIGITPVGNYFSTSREEASGYGDVRPFYLDVKSPLYLEYRTEEIEDADYVAELIEDGYDGIRIAGYYGEAEWVAFSPNQIKSIDNKTPTSDPDIRFSGKGGRARVAEIARLREQNQALREQMKRTKGTPAALPAGNSGTAISTASSLTLDSIRRAVLDVNKKSNTKFSMKNAAQTDGGVKYSLKQLEDGMRYADIEGDQTRFEGLSAAKMQKEAREVILEKFRNKIIGAENRAFVNKRSAEEYAYPAKFIKDADVKASKMRASTELNTLMESSTFLRHEDDDGRHPDAVRGWDKYETTFRVNGRFYKGEVSVKKVARGDIFYSLSKIKDITDSISAQYGESPQGTSVDNVSDNSIRNNSEKSNTKFSMKKATDSEGETPTSDPDIRFSGKGGRARVAEIARLREQNQALREQMKRTKGVKADPKATAALARTILEDYSSSYEQKDVRNRLVQIYNDMGSGVDAKDAALELARDILNDSVEQTNPLYGEYGELRRYIRESRMTIAPQDRGDLGRAGGYEAFRKANFGRFKLVNEGGAGVDTVYHELAELWPEFFPDDITHPAEQIIQMSDVFAGLNPVYENPHAGDMDMAVEFLANEMLEGFFTVPEAKSFADKQAEKMDALRTENKRRLEALRKDKKAQLEKTVRELRETYQSREQSGRERRAAGELRRKISRHSADMSRKLLRPSDKQHIPEGLRTAVASLLHAINLESAYTVDPETGKRTKGDGGDPVKRTEAFYELRRAYTDVMKEGSGYSGIIDPDLADNLDAVAAMSGTRIADMDVEQLRTVWATLRAVEESIANENKLLGKSKFARVSEAAEGIREVLDARPAKQAYGGPRGMADGLLNMDMLTPEAYFHRLGAPGEALFDELRGAQDAHIRLIDQAEADTKQMLGEADISNWRGKSAATTVFHTSGGDITLTPAQVMYLYLAMGREQAKRHILVGGIRQSAIVDKHGKVIQTHEPVHVTEGDVRDITKTLTEEQRRVADALGEYLSSTLSAWGNKASMAVYGYEKFTEKNYIPIHVDPNYVATESGKGADVTIRGRGFTKATMDNAANAIILGDLLDVYAGHVNDMANYAAYLAAVEDVERVKNFRFRDTEAKKTDGSVKNSIARVLGKGGVEYFDNLLRDVNQGVQANARSFSFDAFTGNFKAAVIGANIRVVVQQPTAFIRAAAEIDPKYLAAGLAKKGNWELVKKWAPIAVWKDWGYFDLNTGRQVQDILLGSDSRLEKVKQFGMALAGKADSVTWSKLWNAAEAEVADKNRALRRGSDAYYEAVAARFAEVIDRTQVVDGILQRAQIMRDGNGVVKMATSFMAEPIKSYNVFASALYDAVTEQDPARRSAARRKLARATFTLVVTNVVNAAVVSFIDGLRDDDKKKGYWEKWLAAFFGMRGDEEGLRAHISSALGGNLVDGLNPLNTIPYARDVMSLLQGYDVSRMDMEVFTRAGRAMERAYKSMLGDGTLSKGNAAAELFASFSAVLGLPVSNLKRDVLAVAQTTVQGTGKRVWQYELEKILYAVGSDANKSRYYDLLFVARDDKESYGYIKADLIKNGFSKSDIESAMRSRIKKDEAYMAQKDDVAAGVQRSLERSRGYASLPANYKASAMELAEEYAGVKVLLEADESYSIPTTQNWIEKADAGAKHGIETWEYILFKTALARVNEDGSTTQAEVISALDSMNWLSKAEKSYLFGTRWASDKNNPFK